MKPIIQWDERLDPDSVHYGQTIEQLDAWWAKYAAEEIAWMDAARAERDLQEWSDLTAWWRHSDQVMARQDARDERTFFETYGREPVVIKPKGETK